MEHSYINNEYVDSIMNLLNANPGELTWLCDYHEEPGMQWNDIYEEDDPSKYCIPINHDYVILNHTKECYIDIKKLKKLYEDANICSLIIHPLPILCNSDTQSQGGGDYHKEDSTRATWKGDLIETIIPETGETIPNNYQNITNDCLYFRN